MPFDADDAYNEIEDVEIRLGIGAFSATTFPTDQAVFDWMAQFASKITVAVAEVGLTISPDSASADHLDPTTDLGKLCRAANELNAAGQVLLALDERAEGKEVSGTPKLYLDMASAMLEGCVSIAAIQAGGSGDVRTHTTTGGITSTSYTEDPNLGEERSRSDGWSLDTKN